MLSAVQCLPSFAGLFLLYVFLFIYLFIFTRMWRSVPVPLCFAVPTGSNKLQTCFLSSNSTFAAPSLRHRPYHYPHKQQQQQKKKKIKKKKCLANLCVGGISPAAFCQPPLSGISVVGDLHWMHKNHKENPQLVMNVPALFVPSAEEERMREHVRIYWELTDNMRLLQSVCIGSAPVV